MHISILKKQYSTFDFFFVIQTYIGRFKQEKSSNCKKIYRIIGHSDVSSGINKQYSINTTPKPTSLVWTSCEPGQ